MKVFFSVRAWLRNVTGRDVEPTFAEVLHAAMAEPSSKLRVRDLEAALAAARGARGERMQPNPQVTRMTGSEKTRITCP